MNVLMTKNNNYKKCNVPWKHQQLNNIIIGATCDECVNDKQKLQQLQCTMNTSMTCNNYNSYNAQWTHWQPTN